MKKVITLLTSLIMASVTLCGCVENGGGGADDGNLTAKGYTFYSMNTTATLVTYDDFTRQENLDKFDGFVSHVGRLLNEIENAISTTRTTSGIYKFNNAQAGARVELDDNFHAYKVLSIAKEVYALTDGYYNPAVYYNVAAYGFNGGVKDMPHDSSELPTDDEIAAYMALYAHFDEVEVEKDATNRVFVVKPEYTVQYGGETLSMKLDLGGIGKGYAADIVNGLMDSYGYTTGYFNFGSSSMAIKQFKGGGTYNLGYSNPRYPSEVYARSHVKDTALSTSGDYEQYFLLDNDNDGNRETRYCHVFNPQTGRPIETGIMTATVIGGAAAENDALTTAIMAMGAADAIKFINEELTVLGKKVIFTVDCGADGYKYYTNMADGSYEIVSTDFTKLQTA